MLGQARHKRQEYETPNEGYESESVGIILFFDWESFYFFFQRWGREIYVYLLLLDRVI